NLPRDWGGLLLLIGPFLAKEDDEIGLQARPLCTECGARGVVQPVDALIADPEANPGALATLTCKEFIGIGFQRAVLPDLGAFRHVEGIIRVDSDSRGVHFWPMESEGQRQNCKGHLLAEQR